MTRLNPFFSYFGSKFRLAPRYPEPAHNTIIEPFAGSAGYGLCYPHKKVQLFDTYEPVVVLWDYLIHVSETEFLALPVGNFSKDNKVKDLSLTEGAKALVGFWTTESQTYPSDYPLSKSRGSNWTERKRARLATQLQYIRHWTVDLKSYLGIDNHRSTWFVDPPYEKAGKRYKHNQIDYAQLGNWCTERNGQVIVCEQYPAAWLPFEPLLTSTNASNQVYAEVMWCK